jgi:VCBS repeat-containing protein
MATALAVGDVAVVHYNTSTDAFSFVFLRDVEAGTTVNFTDNGWLAAGGFRFGEDMVTYMAPSAVTAGTIITLTGLNLDAAGDQIIAYQGDPASSTILHLIDFADGNNTVAGDATDTNTTALPPGFTLGVNAVAIAFDESLYAGPISGSPEGLFAALNNSANWFESDAPPVGFIANKKPTIDLDSDNSTENGNDYDTTVTSGGPAVPVADIDIAIDDSDNLVIFAAEIKVNGTDPRDHLTVNGSLPAGIVATAYNPVTGILRLDGQASHAAYEAAIRQVEFSTTDNPNQLKRVNISVNDGVAWSKDASAFIHVSAALPAAPPALDLDANNSSADGADATATYTAGGPAIPVTDIDVTITDADSTTIQSATITILGWARNLGDTLSVAGSLPGGITASTYNASTGVLTLSGPAPLADYQAALHQVVYSNTLPAPSIADRGIEVTVNDGILNSNAATMYMHVVVPPPNAAPVLDLDANNSTTPGANYLTGFTDGGSPVAIADTDVSIIDSDGPNLASATITLTNPQADDVLTFEGTPPAGIAVSGSGTSVVTLTGDASSPSYETALQQITFSNSNIDPSNITRIVEVVVNDGSSDSNTATAIIQVEAVNNSAPVIDLDPNESGGSIRGTFHTNFTENGTPIPIADTDTTITDLDSTTLVSATITLENQHPGDLLSVALPLPGGIAASSYDPGTGVLTLTGVATLDEYKGALQQVLYRNIGDNPATDDRLIEVVVNDGVNTSNVADAVIRVVAMNDAPVIQIDTVVTYLENAAPIALSPLAILTDADDTELNDVTVRITGGTISGDGDTLTVGGSTSGTINGITFLWDPIDHALVLTGASLVTNYQDLLRTVEYHSTSDNPTDFNANSTRTLEWSVSGGTAVTTETTTLDIVAVNDAPQVTAAAAASYTENGAPVVLSPASTAIDVDDINLVAGEVRIVSGEVDGDLLTVNGLQSGTFSGIDFSYNAALHSLTFTHPTDVADYQTFLEAIEFFSTSDNPTDSGLSPTRTLSWSVFDGDAISDLQATVVSIDAVNDAPVAQDGSNSGNEDTAITGTLVATDVDSPSLTYALGAQAAHGTVAVNPDGSYTYTPEADFNGADSFTFTANDGTASSNTATISLTVNPVNDAPVAQDGSNSGNEDTAITGTLVATDVDSPSLTYALGAQAAHGTVAVNPDGSYTYTPEADFNGADSFTFTANDGAASSNTATISLTVNPVNSPPVLDLDADDSTSSGSGYATTFTERCPAVRIADTDIAISASTLRSATIILTNPLPGDLLSVNGTLPGSITAVYDPVTGVMTLTSGAPAAAYQAASDQIVYSNSSDNPSTDERIIAVVVNDGINDSNTATTIVHVVAVNDAPVAQDGSNSGNEDTPISGTLVATDVDSPSLTYALGTQAAYGSVVVNPDGSFSYTPAQDFNGADSFTFLANDGEADSNVATISLVIAAVNDAPRLDLDADDSSAPLTYFVTTFAGSAVPIADVDLAITDPDSPTLTSAIIHLLTPGPGDHLSVNGPLTAGISASAYDPATGILTLSGLASLADYQTAIHQVDFGTSGASSASRIIEVKVNDGTLDSNTAVAVVDFSVPPEPPPATIDPHWVATRDFTPHPAGCSPIIVADLAGDRMSDLLWRSDSTGSLDEWQIVNAGWARSVDLGSHPGTGWQPTSGDFDGDGTDDIFWFDPASGNTDIWKMASGEWAGSINPGPHPPGFQVAATGDFDGDGTSDVLWFSPQTGAVDIWKIEDGQWAGSVNPGPAPAGFSIAGTGDFNHDGSDDVLWFNPTSRDVQIWEMENGQFTRSIDVGTHPAGYTIVGSAEFTGDGTSDVLWFNPTTGDVDLWKMQDGHWAGSVDIGLHPLGWQPIGIGDTDGNGIAGVWWREGTTTRVETWMLSIH